jgi:hypothetical protein
MDRLIEQRVTALQPTGKRPRHHTSGCRGGRGTVIGRAMSSSSSPELALYRRVALNVRRLRNTAGLTVKVAASRGDMHWRHWQKIETGEMNVTIQTMSRLAMALKVDIEVLFRSRRLHKN